MRRLPLLSGPDCPGLDTTAEGLSGGVRFQSGRVLAPYFRRTSWAGDFDAVAAPAGGTVRRYGVGSTMERSFSASGASGWRFRASTLPDWVADERPYPCDDRAAALVEHARDNRRRARALGMVPNPASGLYDGTDHTRPPVTRPPLELDPTPRVVDVRRADAPVAPGPRPILTPAPSPTPTTPSVPAPSPPAPSPPASAPPPAPPTSSPTTDPRAYQSGPTGSPASEPEAETPAEQKTSPLVWIGVGVAAWWAFR